MQHEYRTVKAAAARTKRLLVASLDTGAAGRKGPPMVELNLSDPCPCGSGKPGGACCWRGPSLGFVVPEANPRPPGPKTGHANPECYARSLNDCSEDISKEHYISRNVLVSFAPTGRFDVVNPVW